MQIKLMQNEIKSSSRRQLCQFFCCMTQSDLQKSSLDLGSSGTVCGGGYVWQWDIKAGN